MAEPQPESRPSAITSATDDLNLTAIGRPGLSKRSSIYSGTQQMPYR